MSRTAVEVEREYGPFPGSPGVHGVTFDGEAVWFATGQTLQALDPNTGTPTRSLEVRAGAGVAYDGRHFYQVGDGQIHKVDPHTGKVLASFAAPPLEGGGNSGLAWADGSLWLGRGSENKILELDPKTGKVPTTTVTDRFVTGVTFSEGELWHATLLQPEKELPSELRRVDRRTSEVLERLELPAGVNCTGLEADGKGRFFCGGGKTGKVRVVKQPRLATAK